jgi:hypothetical protein
MRYRLEYALSIETEDSFPTFTVENAECVPRVGDYVSISGRSYTVMAVTHMVSDDAAGIQEPPFVRVK